MESSSESSGSSYEDDEELSDIEAERLERASSVGSIMEDVRNRLLLLQTSRVSFAEQRSMQTISGTPSKRSWWRSNANLEPRVIIPWFKFSFQGALIFLILTCVILSCLSVFMPFHEAMLSITQATGGICTTALSLQHDAIEKVVLDDMAHQSFGLVLATSAQSVEVQVKSPADRAVDSLWGELWAKWNQKERRRTSPHSPLITPSSRQEIIYRSWLELSRNTTLGTIPRPWITFEDVGDQSLYMIYAVLSTGESAGVMVEHGNSSVMKAFSWESKALAPGQTDTVGVTSLLNSVGNAVKVVREEPYNGWTRPFYLVQQQVADAAKSHRGGASAVSSRQLWSPVYEFTDGRLGLSWTSPINYCGSYDCFEGVVAADITLEQMQRICQTRWKRMKSTLLSASYKFRIGLENSSVFVVNHVSSRAPQQEGVLLGAAVTEENQALRMTYAVDSKQRVVSEVSRAILVRFGRWDSADLQNNKQFFNFSTHALRVNSTFERCNPMGPWSETFDCVEVMTRSIPLDGTTRWLVVVAVPARAFNARAAELAEAIRDRVENMERVGDTNVTWARFACLSILIAIGMLGMCLGYCLGWRVSRPLGDLSGLMCDLSELDFSHETPEYVELRNGRGAGISEVAMLQEAFCRLSLTIEAFTYFVPQIVVRRVISSNPNVRERATRLHVERREVTAMFSSIKGFNAISEKLDERRLVFLLTRYFSVATRIVELFEGTVSEILCDGLLVYWNSPDTVEDHAAKACAAAVALQRALEPLNFELESLGLPSLSIYIGLHTGTVLTGNLGSDTKLKFGCLGDPVNLTSRIMGLCKNYGVGVICSAATQAQLPADAGFIMRRLDLVQVKGRNEPLTVYELVGRDCNALTPASAPEAASHQSSQNSGTSLPIVRTTSMPSTSGAVEEAMAESASSLKYIYDRYFAQIKRIWQTSWRRSSLPYLDTRTPSSMRTPPTRSTAATPAFFESCVNELFGASVDAVPRDKIDAVRFYEQALQAYQQAAFPAAIGLCQSALQHHPNDAPSARLLELAQRYVAADGRSVVGLSADELRGWTGVTLMTQK
eukprot:TRINITY_DN2580_c0_g2_i3.p1 TRINITY_DN2580_c0_g2~~TRINITY_DN2580_c0_g2_i3.p1  ORF type:complete len:1063 (+),score=106.46 TRINITY_DN2580_c0_g2_i3:105-3293(+)